VTETRSTRQKDAILRAALASADHPTADMIFDSVRGELPKISLGTVYRNLQRLVAEGRLALAPVELEGDSRARFDPGTHPHDHFVCQGCKRIHDVERGKSGVSFRALERAGFRIDSHSVSVYGLCASCAAEER
jgi:Fe2+ or Zn2+ uptake regulation protein